VVRRIATALDQLNPSEARYLAAFAYLLGRAASADREIGTRETDAMVRIVMEEGALSHRHASMVVDLAKQQNVLFHGTEDFRVSQEFAQIATPEQKLGLLRCLFAVSAADESIVTVEDNEIRRISMELKIPYEDFIAARRAMREKLAVLRPGGGIRPPEPAG
jgi:uncharacterized tellurite resistance protein B-like protein